MIKFKTEKSGKAEAAETRPAIDQKISDLRARYVAATAELLSLEKQGVKPSEERMTGENDRALALQLLNGHAPLTTAMPLGRRLWELYAERRAIDLAIVMAQEKSRKEHAEIVRNRVTERMPEWMALQQRRAETLLSLIKTNAELERLQREMRSGGVVPTLPMTGFEHHFFGNSVRQQTSVNFFVHVFLHECVRAGLIPKKDLEI